MKQMRTYGGRLLMVPTLAEASAALEANDGLCIICGKRTHGYEPDTCGDPCPKCKTPRGLYGGAGLALMGYIRG